MTTIGSNDNSKKPKRKKAAKRAKKIVKKEEQSPEEEQFDPGLKRQIRAALQLHLDEFVKRKNLSHKQVQAVNSFIEEYLSCFVLLGYTYDGFPVTVVNAKSPKDSDSLGTMLQKFLIMNMDVPPPPNMF
ncbi:hypothetical protein CL622_02175 [archaeon]|nr:hypothetical protein [archaeon]